MNVYVCVKQVPDTETKIALKDLTHIDEASVKKWIVNPYDEFAVEEAVRLKEKRTDVQVIVVSLGAEKAQEALRASLAMGADRGIHVVCDEFLDHHRIATVLANAIKNDGEPALIFMGKQAIDDDASQVHLRLAHMLGASAATHVVAFELKENRALVSREIDEGAKQNVELALPAVVAVAKGINTPRYPTLPNIMKAKKKEIKTLRLADVGAAAIANTEQIVNLSLPRERAAGKVLKGESRESAVVLVNLLKNEAKVV